MEKWSNHLLSNCLRTPFRFAPGLQDEDEEGQTVSEFPWMLGALRSSEVLTEFVYLFVCFFLEDMCAAVEAEAAFIKLRELSIFPESSCIV